MAKTFWRLLAVSLSWRDWVVGKEMFCEITGPCKSVGPSHTMHLRVDGSAFGIGRNNFGQLGDGTRIHATSPQMASTQSPVSYVSVGGWHTLFLRRDGQAIAVGKNDVGQLGDGTTMSTPAFRKMLFGSEATKVSAGNQHSLFLRRDGTAWAAGGNEYGQLGVGDYAFRHTPEQVLTNVTAISAGESHSIFVRIDGSVWVTGKNDFGQLGDSSTLQRATPGLAVIDSVESVIAGQHKTIFIKKDGSVWATGQKDDELGYHAGSDWPRSTPTRIAAKLEDVLSPEGSASIEEPVLGQPVYATDQRFLLDDPYYGQNLPNLAGIGFDGWNYR